MKKTKEWLFAVKDMLSAYAGGVFVVGDWDFGNWDKLERLIVLFCALLLVAVRLDKGSRHD